MKMMAVLHDVRSVHNVGSIFRTADAAGMKRLVLCGITPTPHDRFKNIRADFAKVALGAERSVAWEHVRSTADAIGQLKSDGWKIFAVEQSPNAVPYRSVRRYLRGGAKGAQKIALILGNEVDGVPTEILAMADQILEIPMHGAKESLNVAVAFGIVAFGLQD